MKKDKNFEQNLNGRNFNSYIRGPCNIISLIVSILLLPILIINCCLIVKSIVKPDEVPSLGKYSFLIVLTESMEPDIKPGDLILCKKTSISDIKEGMVISFYDPASKSKTIVTHKINKIEVNEDGTINYYTQGINNNIEDRYPVPSENVIGVYTKIRFMFIGSIIIFIQKPVGLITCVIAPILIIGIVWIVLWQKEQKKKQKKLQDELENLKSQVTNDEKNE